MRSMTKFWTTLACLGVLGCAEGSPSKPVMDIEPQMEAPPPTCGNGVVDPGEDCDCGKDVSTVCQIPNMMECSLVNRGAGALLCKAQPSCKWDFSMCANSTPAPMGGTGAMPGAGGTGGTGR
jgi:hypothetical protein